MILSASIMAHPDRHLEVFDLRSRLDWHVPVAWDNEGPASGNSDRVWRTARRAWLMFDPAADFHALIQDDAIVCRDFLAGMEIALDHVPADALVSPYLGQGRNVSPRWAGLAQRADDRGAVWIRTMKAMWGVCLIAPTALIPQMIEDCDRRTGVPDDMRVAGWFDRRGLEVWYPWPSLVDHRQVPSLTKHRAPDRIARRHHLGSALELKWDGPVVTDPMVTRRKGVRSRPRVY